MNAEKLDLRDTRCPLSLLMVKRHLNDYPQLDSWVILLKDPASKKDIVRFLEKKHCQVDEQNNTGYYTLTVTIGSSSNV